MIWLPLCRLQELLSGWDSNNFFIRNIFREISGIFLIFLYRTLLYVFKVNFIILTKYFLQVFEFICLTLSLPEKTMVQNIQQEK